MKYYAICGFGGILSCGITHTAVVPLDLVKCRIQVKLLIKLTFAINRGLILGTNKTLSKITVQPEEVLMN